MVKIALSLFLGNVYDDDENDDDDGKNKGRCNSSHKISRNWFATLLENKTILQQKNISNGTYIHDPKSRHFGSIDFGKTPKIMPKLTQ